MWIPQPFFTMQEIKTGKFRNKHTLSLCSVNIYYHPTHFNESSLLLWQYNCYQTALYTCWKWNCSAARSTIIRHSQHCSISHTIHQGHVQDSLFWANQHGTLWEYTAIRGWHTQLVGQWGYIWYFSNLNLNWNIWATFLTINGKHLQMFCSDHWWICRNTGDKEYVLAKVKIGSWGIVKPLVTRWV